MFSALSRKVRAEELKPAEAQRVATQFRAHLEANLYTRLPVERRHYTLARDWIARFTTSLRTLDALHLAVASAEGLRFATADRVLARSGEALGTRIVLVA
jgi:predicted nucleic acid-binding protein